MVFQSFAVFSRTPVYQLSDIHRHTRKPVPLDIGTVGFSATAVQEVSVCICGYCDCYPVPVSDKQHVYLCIRPTENSVMIFYLLVIANRYGSNIVIWLCS